MNIQYVLGSKPVPDWVNEACNKGLIKQVKNEDNGEITYTVYETTNIVNASKGDKLVKTRSGIAVIAKQNKKEEKIDEDI